MNQLSHNVIDLARYRRAAAMPRRRGGTLNCRWRRDIATGQLVCAWTTQKGAREAQPPLRRTQASRRTPTMNDGPSRPAEFASSVSTGAPKRTQTAISNRRAEA